MAIWLIRAGSHGEYEQKFISESKVFLTWNNLNVDLSTFGERSDLIAVLEGKRPDAKTKTLSNWSSQIWPFAHEMQVGDLVVVPSKAQPVIYIGQITGSYQFNAKAENPYYHHRTVKWVGEAIPRSHFSQDLLYSFGAFMTICRIQRNEAEARIKAMMAKGWMPETLQMSTAGASVATQQDSTNEVSDLEQLARDQIARAIEAKFKGHEFTRLIEAILKAQGYTTYLSNPGADGGADILAGAGPMGFGAPSLCVEVKSENTAIDRPTVDKLLGAVSKFGAQHGLFVAWGGFKSNVAREMATSFFKVRLWTQNDVLEQLFMHYDKLDESIKAELPLKRVWSLALADEE